MYKSKYLLVNLIKYENCLKLSGRNVPRERSDIELCDLSKSILHRLIRANEDTGKHDCKQLRKLSSPFISAVVTLGV